MSIWHPIETAPKDGTQLLLWWGSKPVISYYAERTGFKGWQPPSMMPIKVTDRSMWNPTHWMPLPSAPSDPAQEPEAVAYLHEHQEFHSEVSFHRLQMHDMEQGWKEAPLYRARPALDREALLDRVVKFDECETSEPTLRKMVLGYYMQGLQPDSELAGKYADRFILALIEGRT